MKLHILNDLHIEFEDFEPPATDADVVILAGDIGVGRYGLHWAEKRFPDRSVIYVPGNHEFYRHDITLIDELKAQLPDPIHFSAVPFIPHSNLLPSRREDRSVHGTMDPGR